MNEKLDRVVLIVYLILGLLLTAGAIIHLKGVL